MSGLTPRPRGAAGGVFDAVPASRSGDRVRSEAPSFAGSEPARNGAAEPARCGAANTCSKKAAFTFIARKDTGSRQSSPVVGGPCMVKEDATSDVAAQAGLECISFPKILHDYASIDALGEMKCDNSTKTDWQ